MKKAPSNRSSFANRLSHPYDHHSLLPSRFRFKLLLSSFPRRLNALLYLFRAELDHDFRPAGRQTLNGNLTLPYPYKYRPVSGVSLSSRPVYLRCRPSSFYNIFPRKCKICPGNNPIAIKAAAITASMPAADAGKGIGESSGPVLMNIQRTNIK